MTVASESKPLDLVVAITGASGSIYATRLLQVLVNSGRRVHVTISPSGAYLAGSTSTPWSARETTSASAVVFRRLTRIVIGSRSRSLTR